MFSLASPIWIASSENPVNEYGEFLASFSLSSLSEKVIARIAAASDFALLVNEEMAGFGQYPHFHDEKFVEEIDITPYVKLGENKIRIIALSRDYPTASQVRSGKWLIFEFLQGEEVLSYSSIHTKSRKEPHYQSGKFPYITNQLGQGYRYSFEAKEEPFVPSKEISASWRYSPRPVKRLLVGEKLPFTPLGPRLFDGGKELVGYLYFEIDSEIPQTMVVSFGEHIVDGGVRRIIGDRDFS
ncbi:MAG: hypothetical protein SPI58_05855, partial [Candidatus Enteromonas sp.]|nr:hypothetical protein [Candidatus Enteromonas sp.]